MKFSEYINSRVILSEDADSMDHLDDDEHASASEKLADLPAVPKEQIFFKNPDKGEVFLKDIGFKPHGRVYHISDGDREKIKPIKISLKHIGKGQPSCQREGIQRAIDMAKDHDTSTAKKKPFVVIEDGTAYVQDGHHRMCALKLAGRKHAVVDAIVKKGDKFYVPNKSKELEWQTA